MRDQFAAWYPLSQEQRGRFVTDGLIVLDTNVLLDLYRMNSEARDDLLALLRSLGKRLWIPHQVGLEFHRSRLEVIHDQEQVDRRLRVAVEEATTKVRDAVKSVRDHPVINRALLTDIVDKATESILAYLDTASAEPYLSMKTAMHEDPVLDTVTTLLDGKVGESYPADQIGKVLTEAKLRIEQKRPPGYSDARKPDDGAAGDYILWRQTIDEAIRRKMPVLLVTNDQKEDWYRKLHGLTVGPRVELISEMSEEAGVAFHAQTLTRFVETAPSLMHLTVKGTTVSEVSRLDEVGRALTRTETTSDIAQQEFRHGRSSWPRERASEIRGPTVRDHRSADILRLEDRRRDLVARVAYLRDELEAARRSTGEDGGRQPHDPRSYARAIETRLEASYQMLADVDDEFEQLRLAADGRLR